MHSCRISLGLSVTQPGDWSHSEAVSGCLAVLGCLTTARPRDFSIPDLSSENWKEEFPARHPSSHQQFEFYLIVIFGSVVKLVKLFMIQILQEIRKFSFLASPSHKVLITTWRPGTSSKLSPLCKRVSLLFCPGQARSPPKLAAAMWTQTPGSRHHQLLTAPLTLSPVTQARVRFVDRIVWSSGSVTSANADIQDL